MTGYQTLKLALSGASLVDAKPSAPVHRREDPIVNEHPKTLAECDEAIATLIPHIRSIEFQIESANPARFHGVMTYDEWLPKATNKLNVYQRKLASIEAIRRVLNGEEQITRYVDPVSRAKQAYDEVTRYVTPDRIASADTQSLLKMETMAGECSLLLDEALSHVHTIGHKTTASAFLPPAKKRIGLLRNALNQRRAMINRLPKEPKPTDVVEAKRQEDRRKICQDRDDAEESCRRLASEVERLTSELSSARAATAEATLALAFMSVAREVLAEHTYGRILARARGRR